MILLTRLMSDGENSVDKAVVYFGTMQWYDAIVLAPAKKTSGENSGINPQRL